jgi:hypothetical protein
MWGHEFKPQYHEKKKSLPKEATGTPFCVIVIEGFIVYLQHFLLLQQSAW